MPGSPNAMDGSELSMDDSSIWGPNSSDKPSTASSDVVQFQNAAFLLLNIRSINPSATSECKHKHKELEKLISESCQDVPVKFVAVTETWLQDHIKDAQLHIGGFNISRCDREDRGGGGVLLYSHYNYPISECKTYDDSYCSALFVKFSSI